MKNIIIGGVPNPIGGVTTYIRRYLLANSNEIDKVIDFYAGKKEPIDEICRKKIVFVSGVAGLIFWFLFSNTNKEPRNIFFNFSTPRACLVLFFLKKNCLDHWSLMLHDGKLPLDNDIIKTFAKLSLNKIDTVCYLSKEQEIVYKSLGVLGYKLRQSTSYCPPTHHKDDEDALSEIIELRKKFRSLSVISGYPSKIYHIEDAINVFKNFENKHNFLCVFIYGSGDLRDLIYNLVSNSDCIKVFEGVSENYFNTFLKYSDLFLRLTEYDSVGIAVWDADYWGVNVIATDVCIRPTSASIIKSGYMISDLNDVIKFKLNRICLNSK